MLATGFSGGCRHPPLPAEKYPRVLVVIPRAEYIKGDAFMAKCGLPTEVFSRVVGYHRPIKNWNKGKQEEFHDRKTYSVQARLRNNDLPAIKMPIPAIPLPVPETAPSVSETLSSG